MIAIDSDEFFLPAQFKIKSAIDAAAPVFSRITPKLVPATITIPIAAKVFPKPDFIVEIICSGVSPADIPTPNPARIST